MCKLILSLALLFSLCACGGGDGDPFPSFKDIPVFENNVPDEGSGGLTDNEAPESATASITLENGEMLASAFLNDFLDLVKISDIALGLTMDQVAYLSNLEPMFYQSKFNCDNDSNSINTDSFYSLFPLDTNGLNSHKMAYQFNTTVDSDGNIINCQLNDYNLSGNLDISNIIYKSANDNSGDWTLTAMIDPRLILVLEPSSIKEFVNPITFEAIFTAGNTAITISTPTTIVIQKADPATPSKPWYSSYPQQNFEIKTYTTPNSIDGIQYKMLISGNLLNSITGINNIISIPSPAYPLQWVEISPFTSSPSAGELIIKDNSNNGKITLTIDNITTLNITDTTSSSIEITWPALLKKARAATMEN